MTTYVPFAPSSATGFSFSTALDGRIYQLTVWWNISGQRWYLRCNGENSSLLFCVPLIGSPSDGNINLIGPWFQVSSLVFRNDTQTFEIRP